MSKPDSIENKKGKCSKKTLENLRRFFKIYTKDDAKRIMWKSLNLCMLSPEGRNWDTEERSDAMQFYKDMCHLMDNAKNMIDT